MQRVIDAERYPKTAAYVEQLPGGLDAYPACQVKASVLRSALESRPMEDTAGLPGILVGLLRSPPTVNAWMPEVHLNACMLTIYDTWFGPEKDQLYDLWIYERNLELFRKPLYRILFAVLSPERLLVGMQTRWNAFRRGTSIVIESKVPGAVVLRIEHPPRLYPIQSVRAFAAAMRSAIVSAGAKSASAKGMFGAEGVARIEVKWLAA